MTSLVYSSARHSNEKNMKKNFKTYSTSGLRGLAYIHTCRSYVNTPRGLDRHVSHKSLEASNYNKAALADSFDLGLLGEQSSQK